MSRKNRKPGKTPSAVRQASVSRAGDRPQPRTASRQTVDCESSSSGRSLRLIEQRRAEFALQRLQEALAEPENGKYKHTQLKSYLRRLPAMIQMNGFGQAMAFYYAKRTSYAAYGVVYKLLEDWLCGDGAVYAGQAVTPGLHPAEPALLQALMSHDQHHYRRATAETQALLAWAKKFAEALIVKDDAEVE